MHLKFPPCLRSGDYPVICDDVRKDYGSHTVFDHVTMTIRRGEKVAFVGRNGEGKTTLVKCIMGEVDYTGKLKIGHNVQIGYFAQNQAQLLDEELTVFDTIDRVAKGDIRLKINNLLGAFMFGGEASEKKVKVLSGGERSRLAMIRLLLEPVNLLILDEPTNHLDMQSKDILKEAINAFDGTAIIVSHDREFLDGLVTKVYEFGGGKAREHIGGIYDWIRSCGNTNADISSTTIGQQLEINAAQQQPPAATSTKQNGNSQSSTNKQHYAERKEHQRKISRLEKSVSQIERTIAHLEARIKELDALLCTPEGASNMVIVTEYTTTKKLIDDKTDQWEQLSLELEELKKSIEQ